MRKMFTRKMQGRKQRPSMKRDCFDCGRSGHFEGSVLCKKKRSREKRREKQRTV